MSSTGTAPGSLAPQRGISGRVYSATGGRVSLPVLPKELNDREISNGVRTTISAAAVVIGVVGPKGEATKTTSCLNLANALTFERCFPVLIIEINPVGNIGSRIGHRTDCPSVDGLVAAIRADKIKSVLDFNAYTVRTDVGTRVMGRPKFKMGGEKFGPSELELVLDCAKQFYEIILLDAGNDPSTELCKAMFGVVDAVLMATTTKADSHDLGEDIIKEIYLVSPTLRAKVVTVVTAKVPTPSKDHKEVATIFEPLSATGRDGSAQVFQVDHDPALAKVRDVHWGNVSPGTQEAFRRLASSVMLHVSFLRDGGKSEAPPAAPSAPAPAAAKTPAKKPAVHRKPPSGEAPATAEATTVAPVDLVAMASPAATPPQLKRPPPIQEEAVASDDEPGPTVAETEGTPYVIEEGDTLYVISNNALEELLHETRPTHEDITAYSERIYALPCNREVIGDNPNGEIEAVGSQLLLPAAI